MSKKFKTPGIESPNLDILTKPEMSFAKWLPLLAAGAAAGVSLIALKEIKSVRNEILIMKKEQSSGVSDELTKKIHLMESQLQDITDFLKNGNTKAAPNAPSKVVKNVVKEELKPVNIVNDNEDEYEEVEVTDHEDE